MVKFKALIFFGISIATIIGIFILFPDTFDTANPNSDLSQFLERGIVGDDAHWWGGFVIFSLFFAGLLYYIAVRRTAPSFLAFFFLLGFVTVLGGALLFTQTSAAAHLYLKDTFWTAANTGDWKPLLGVVIGPLVIFSIINGLPVYFMVGNSATKAVTGVELLPTGEGVMSRHKKPVRRVKTVKMKKRKRR